MSLLKTVPEGFKPQECKGINLREQRPVPYMPLKDEVQVEVVRMQTLKIKMAIKKDTTLNFAVWQKKGDSRSFFDACNRSN